MTPEDLAAAKGQRISAAFSSLTEFSCELENGKGLVLKAVETPAGARVECHLVAASQLPRDMDAVCKVDWGWIVSSVIEDAAGSPTAVRFQLQPSGPLTISVQTWQGKPFLAFQPFRPAK